jgi:hypothetical protein
MNISENLYVLSLRDVNKTPAMCCVVELEDIIINNFNGQLISLGTEIKTNGVLFVAAISMHDLVNSLMQVPVSEFRAIYAYVFDAFISPLELTRPQWRNAISRRHRTIRKITHLFIPFRQSVNDFSELFQIPVSYIPLASNVVDFGGYESSKIIDVNGYGRQPPELTKLLSERFNKRESKRVYAHTNHAGISAIHDFYQHRRLFWKLLRKSRIALLFDALHTPLDRNFPFSFVPQRMFESAAAGCVIVGKRPICSEIDELFNWSDHFIELPDRPVEMIDFIEHLLDNYDLESAGRRNYEECLRRHDWRHRINEVIKIAGLAD